MTSWREAGSASTFGALGPASCGKELGDLRHRHLRIERPQLDDVEAAGVALQFLQGLADLRVVAGPAPGEDAPRLRVQRERTSGAPTRTDCSTLSAESGSAVTIGYDSNFGIPTPRPFCGLLGSGTSRAFTTSSTRATASGFVPLTRSRFPEGSRITRTDPSGE